MPHATPAPAPPIYVRILAATAIQDSACELCGQSSTWCMPPPATFACARCATLPAQQRVCCIKQWSPSVEQMVCLPASPWWPPLSSPPCSIFAWSWVLLPNPVQTTPADTPLLPPLGCCCPGQQGSTHPSLHLLSGRSAPHQHHSCYR